MPTKQRKDERIRECLTQRAPTKAHPPQDRGHVQQPALILPDYHFIVVLIPAHNEEARIDATLDSIAAQSRPPDLVVVVADNCSDHTVAHAQARGAVVWETADNHNRKAGALNQALVSILDELDDDDAVLLMDADTSLNPRFVETTTRLLWASRQGRQIGGVGGIFEADDATWSLIRQIQSNEYVRYARQLGRRRGRAMVLTGTGSVFKAATLRAIVAARKDGSIPDESGEHGVYDAAAMTEDNELTLAVKALGLKTVSPMSCEVFTAMMPSIHALYEQRRRWQRGALENLSTYRMRWFTFPYISRQMLTYLAVLFAPLYLLCFTVTLAEGRSINFLIPLWVAVAALYVVEQTWSVQRGGWRAIVVSVAIIPEALYALFLNVVYVVALAGYATRRSEHWGRGERALNAMTSTPLSGDHDMGGHLGQRLLVGGFALGAIIVLCLPFFELRLAWQLVAAFVLLGSANTLFRLVPLPRA